MPPAKRFPYSGNAMSQPFPQRAVLQPTDWCVVRRQSDEHLFYNSRTDELHLVPPTGFLAYQLCDGFRSVSEIENQIAESSGLDSRVLRQPLVDFFRMLVARGILEIADVQAN